mgnify:CR=1 FL=1
MEDLFWGDLKLAQSYYHTNICIDEATFDIDSDGVTEHCALYYGPTSGICTVALVVDDEYANMYHFQHGQLSFTQTENGMVLRLIPNIDETAVIDYTFSVQGGNIVLTDNYGYEAEYFGSQGLEYVKPMDAILGENGEVLYAESHPQKVN